MKAKLCLALMLSFTTAVAAQGLKITRSATADLDGDGRSERISITIGQRMPDGRTDGDRYELRVGSASVKGDLENVKGFTIVDLDTRDRYKEVAVFTPGPSDDPRYVIYWYDGKQLRQVGDIGAGISVQGNGIVMAAWWTGNFLVRDKYVLEKGKHTLHLVPQEMYYVGEEHKVLSSFPIHYSPVRHDVVANLENGSRALVMALKQIPLPRKANSDPDRLTDDWLLIKSRSGLLGWARLTDAGGKLDLNSAD